MSERDALEERWPCLWNERHTFAADETACLCGALWRANANLSPEVVFYTPNTNYYLTPSEKVGVGTEVGERS